MPHTTHKTVNIASRVVVVIVVWAIVASILFNLAGRVIFAMITEPGSRDEVLTYLWSMLVVAVPSFVSVTILFWKKMRAEAVSVVVAGILTGLYLIMLIAGFGGFDLL